MSDRASRCCKESMPNNKDEAAACLKVTSDKQSHMWTDKGHHRAYVGATEAEK